MFVRLALLAASIAVASAHPFHIEPRPTPPPFGARGDRPSYPALRNIPESQDPAVTDTSLWPLPASLSTTPECWGVVEAEFSFTSVGYTTPSLQRALLRYSAITFSYGPSAQGTRPPLRVLTVNVTSDDDELRIGIDEAYTLSVAGGGAVLTASTYVGALRGLETWSQLVGFNATDSTYFVCGATVQDAPRFPLRGVLVDCARHFMSVAVLKQTIDSMNFNKLNALHLHLTDDQSWSFEVEAYPLLAANGAYSARSIYTKAIVADLVAYAADRGVVIIPEIESPSHDSAIARSYPQMMAPAKDPNAGNASYLCMVDLTQPELFPFWTAIWSEAAANFRSNYIHIGGDEVWACWTQSATMTAWLQAHNMTWYEGVYYYERQLLKHLAPLKKQILVWQDEAGFPDKNETYNDYPNVVFDVWSGCYSGVWQDDVGEFTKQNASVIVSGPFYITGKFSWEDMYAVDLFNFTDATPAQQARVLGGELAAWDDAAGTDSGDLQVALSLYLLAVGENLCVTRVGVVALWIVCVVRLPPPPHPSPPPPQLVPPRGHRGAVPQRGARVRAALPRRSPRRARPPEHCVWNVLPGRGVRPAPAGVGVRMWGGGGGWRFCVVFPILMCAMCSTPQLAHSLHHAALDNEDVSSALDSVSEDVDPPSAVVVVDDDVPPPAPSTVGLVAATSSEELSADKLLSTDVSFDAVLPPSVSTPT